MEFPKGRNSFSEKKNVFPVLSKTKLKKPVTESYSSNNVDQEHINHNKNMSGHSGETVGHRFLFWRTDIQRALQLALWLRNNILNLVPPSSTFNTLGLV